MKSKGSRLALLGVLALALSVIAGFTMGGTAVAKKKGKTGGTVDITQPVNAQIPEPPNSASIGLLTSTITVGGKKFKNTQVRDVNVTVQTTGSTGNPANPSAGDLAARVTSPSGATSWLFGQFELFGQSIGPLTLDDETTQSLGTGLNGAARNPTELGPPYAGSMQPDQFNTLGPALMATLDNGPVTGVWTLRVYDASNAGPATSILNSWRLTVQAGKKYLTK